MADVFRLMAEAVRRAPSAVELAGSVQRARRGELDPFKLGRDALNVYRPGAGEWGTELAEQVTQAISLFGGRLDGSVVDGQVRETDPALDRFVDWLVAQAWGVWVILGPKDGGKTSLALRLAEVWHDELGYPVWGCNIYPEDGLPLVTTIDLDTLSKVVKVLTAATKGRAKTILDEFDDEDDAPRKPAKRLPPLDALRRKIIVIDEASLAMGNSGADKGRRIARQVMAAARHMKWHVIFCAQLARMVPLDLLNSEATFVKKPLGNEVWTDRAGVPEVETLWRGAEEGFANLSQHPYRGDYPRNVAWAKVFCPSGRFNGMMPFGRPGENREATA